MRRTLLLGAIIVVSLVLESTLLAHLRVGGVHADVLVIAVIAVAMVDGPVTAAIFGFAAGLVSDLLFANQVGVSALVYTVIGFGMGVGRVWVTSSSTLVHLLLAAPLVALYNLLLTPLVFPPVRALLERLEPVPTVRW